MDYKISKFFGQYNIEFGDNHFIFDVPKEIIELICYLETKVEKTRDNTQRAYNVLTNEFEAYLEYQDMMVIEKVKKLLKESMSDD